MSLFCKHNYEIKDKDVSCEEIITTLQCKKCGKLIYKKASWENHRFVHYQGFDINCKGVTREQIYFMKCEICGKLKEYRVS